MVLGDSGVTHKVAPESKSGRVQVRRAALASAIGTTIEWYDFFIYGTAAAVVFAPQFFPQVSRFAGTLAAFATFAVGFVARPLGGIVMGHFGDRLGRLVPLDEHAPPCLRVHLDHPRSRGPFLGGRVPRAAPPQSLSRSRPTTDSPDPALLLRLRSLPTTLRLSPRPKPHPHHEGARPRDGRPPLA